MKTATKRGQGRKPKAQDEAIASILASAKEVGKFVKLGLSMTDASRAAGVNPRTLYSWLDKAKAGKPGYEQVSDLIETDRAIGQAVLAQRVAKASEDDWRAAAWILERRHTDAWGKADKLTLAGAVDLNLANLSDAEVEAQIQATERELLQLGKSDVH